MFDINQCLSNIHISSNWGHSPRLFSFYISYGNHINLKFIIHVDRYGMFCLHCNGLRNTLRGRYKPTRINFPHSRTRLPQISMPLNAKNKHSSQSHIWKMRRIARDFGVTPDELERRRRESKCEICGRPPRVRRPDCIVDRPILFLDHDHNSGIYRGLLCPGCNSSLGWFERNTDAIINYLERFEQSLQEFKSKSATSKRLD